MTTKNGGLLGAALLASLAMACTLNTSGLATWPLSSGGDARTEDLSARLSDSGLARDGRLIQSEVSKGAEVGPDGSDVQAVDAGEVARRYPETGRDFGVDTGSDAGSADTTERPVEAGVVSGTEVGTETGFDTRDDLEVGLDVGPGTGIEAGFETAREAGIETRSEVGKDVGVDVRKCASVCFVGCNVGCGPAGQCLACPTCTCQIESVICHC
jgi:hypothetical protein